MVCHVFFLFFFLSFFVLFSGLSGLCPPPLAPPLPQCDKDVPPQRRYIAYFLLCLFHLPFHSTTRGGVQDRPHPRALLCVTRVTHASTARHTTRAGIVPCTTRASEHRA